MPASNRRRRVSLSGVSRIGVPAVALAAALTVALAGCTPEPLRQAAVHRSAGGAAVVLALCAGDRPARISVYEATGNPGREWSITGPPEGADLGSVTLFTVPPGWQASGDLDALAPGQRYELSVRTANSHRSVVPGFTVADLAGLGAGEVWAADGDQGRAMAEPDFRRLATDRCG